MIISPPLEGAWPVLESEEPLLTSRELSDCLQHRSTIGAARKYNWGTKEIELEQQRNTTTYSAIILQHKLSIRAPGIYNWGTKENHDVHETVSSFEQIFFLQHKPRWICNCPSWAEINPSFSSEIENLNFLFTDFSSSNIIRLLVAKHYGQDLS